MANRTFPALLWSSTSRWRHQSRAENTALRVKVGLKLLMLPDVLPFFEKGNVIVEVEQDRNYEENKVSPRI